MLRSKCYCWCHKPGYSASHVAACCEPDPIIEKGPMLEKLEAMHQLNVWVLRRIGSELGHEDDAHYFDELEYCDDEIIKCCIRIADIIEMEEE